MRDATKLVQRKHHININIEKFIDPENGLHGIYTKPHMKVAMLSNLHWLIQSRTLHFHEDFCSADPDMHKKYTGQLMNYRRIETISQGGRKSVHYSGCTPEGGRDDLVAGSWIATQAKIIKEGKMDKFLLRKLIANDFGFSN